MSHINVAKNNRSEGAHSLEYKKVEPSMMLLPPPPLSLLLPPDCCFDAAAAAVSSSVSRNQPLMMMMMIMMRKQQLELGLRWLEGSDLHTVSALGVRKTVEDFARSFGLT